MTPTSPTNEANMATQTGFGADPAFGPSDPSPAVSAKGFNPGEGFTPGPWGKDARDAATLARFIQRPTNRDCTDQIAETIEALEQISKLCPPFVGDYDDTATPSDFGNSDDYARHVQALTTARVGDVARAALAKARGEA